MNKAMLQNLWHWCALKDLIESTLIELQIELKPSQKKKKSKYGYRSIWIEFEWIYNRNVRKLQSSGKYI